MSDKFLLIALCGETFPNIKDRFGNFDQWFVDGLAGANVATRVWNAHAGDPAPDIENCIGVLITGSPAMVTDRAEWSVNLGQWLVQLLQENMPILGVCYGHQLLADSLGGVVDFQPDGREIGSLLVQTTLEAQRDPLFAACSETFYAQLTHAQSVLRLPEGAVRLAGSTRVEHQAFRVGEHCWGLQFHPEFTKEIMLGYLNAYHDQIPAELRVQLSQHLHECEEARQLLVRFAAYCLSCR